MKYNRELKKKLCEDICINHSSTLKTANEYGIPIKTLEKWITAYNKDIHCFDPIILVSNDFKIINNIISYFNIVHISSFHIYYVVFYIFYVKYFRSFLILFTNFLFFTIIILKLGILWGKVVNFYVNGRIS